MICIIYLYAPSVGICRLQWYNIQVYYAIEVVGGYPGDCAAVRGTAAARAPQIIALKKQLRSSIPAAVSTYI